MNGATSSVSAVRCRICSAAVEVFDHALVLHKHPVDYYRCPSCGFIQTQAPYWLEQAYSTAMTSIDIGPVSRAMSCSYVARSVILAAFDWRRVFLDFGGGYGLFVRRMRDLGFDFRLYDEYCENLFAKAHQVRLDALESFELVTAFEVVEHLVSPMEVFWKLRALSENILFSTCLVPEPAPKIGEWWYYDPRHGQHISFFSWRSLHRVAQQLGLRLYSAGDIHLMTKESLNPRLIPWLVTERSAAPIGYLLAKAKGVRSLLASDFKSISGHVID